jgi:hypothetical protein
MSAENINTDCLQNCQAGERAKPSGRGAAVAQDVPDDQLYFTDEHPPAELLGKRRHFFAKPSIKGYS